MSLALNAAGSPALQPVVQGQELPKPNLTRKLTVGLSRTYSVVKATRPFEDQKTNREALPQAVFDKALAVLPGPVATLTNKENVRPLQQNGNAAQLVSDQSAKAAAGAGVGAKQRAPILIAKRTGGSKKQTGDPRVFDRDVKKDGEVAKAKEGTAYKIAEFLGAGAFGKVHAAIQNVFRGMQVTKTDVVLKSSLTRGDFIKRFSHLPAGECVLRAQAKANDALAALKQEARNYDALKGVKHIASKLQAGMHTVGGERCYALVLPRFKYSVSMYCLSATSRFHVLPFSDFLKLAEGGLEALIGSKERGWVHRDIKPRNVFYEPVIGTQLIDLGGACPLKDVGDSLAHTTSAYIAPEVLLGAPWDCRMDVWSFGVLLWEVFVGARLFSAKNVVLPGGAKAPDNETLYMQLIAQQLGFPPLELIKAARFKDHFFKLEGEKYQWKTPLPMTASAVEQGTSQGTSQGTLQGVLPWMTNVKAEAACRQLSAEQTELLLSFLQGMLAYERQQPEQLFQHPFLKIQLAQASATAAAASKK